MTIQQAQRRVDEWIRTTGVRYFNELTNTAILTEEVGELARHMARQYGEQSYQKGSEPSLLKGAAGGPIADEMADVFWVLLCLANQTGVDLTSALELNFQKKMNRDGTRHQENEKLNPSRP